MKRYLTIKNFRNINPVIVGKEAEYNSEKKEDEVKYGRLYLNGDIEQGALISIIGANGTGKSNILSAIEKSFKGGINGRKDNPKIDGFIGCKPELEIFIEADSGLVYKGKCKTIRIKKTGYSEKDEYKDKLVWELEENKINADIILSKNYLLKILDYIYNATNNVSSKYGSSIYFVYEYNYKYDNKSKTEYAYEDILNYTVSKIMDIISKYKEN